MVKALRYVQVEPILPEGLKSLKEIALNLWWCWNQEAIRLFRRIDSKLWEETGHNPIKLLAQIHQDKLEKLEKDLSFRAHLEASIGDLVVYQHNSNWFNEQHFQPSSRNRLFLGGFGSPNVFRSTRGSRRVGG